MSLDNLPEGWLSSKLIDVCEIILGQSPEGSSVNQDKIGIVFYQGKTEFGKMHPKPRHYCTQPKKIAEKDDILLSVRAPVGPTNVANETTAIGRGLAAIRAPLGINYQFVLHYFKYMEPWLSQQGTGTTFKAISGDFIKNLTFIVPSQKEQKEIVRQLDVMLAQVEQIKARLDAIPAILKKFRQSVLADAVNGKLTEMINFQREDFYDFVDELIKLNKKNKSIDVKEFSEYKSYWKDIPLGLLVDQDRGIPYGIVQTGDDTDGGINTVRCGDVLPFKVRSSNLKRVDKNIEKNYLRTRLKGGEVILAIRGSVGNAAVVTSDLISEPLNISREVAMIPVISKLDPYYLTIFLQSPSGRQVLLEQTRGVAQKGINLDDLRKLYIPLPTIEEQKLIVEKVNTLFGFSNHIEEVVESAQKRVNLLTQSILAKAFSGELTAEWREQHQDLITGVNSAESLLAKIQAEREASKPVKKARKAN